MEKILERYERYSYAEKKLTMADPDTLGNWCHEYGMLKSKVEALQKSQRHLMGEQIDSLTAKELKQLEQQLESALKLVRSRKDHLLFDSIAELQQKEKLLQEQNRTLKKMLVEKEKAKSLTQHAQWEQPNQPKTDSSPPSLMISETLPTLNIGTYQSSGPTEAEGTPQPLARVKSTTLPSWMLRPVNG